MSGSSDAIRPSWFMRRLWSEWLTPSSKVMILAIIASLNAVWGYPLIGLLASLLTLLGLGAIANWLMRPRLSAIMQLPEVVAANSVVDARLTIENKGAMPTFDLVMSMVSLPSHWVVLNSQPLISQLSPHETFSIRYSVQVAGRGVYAWPAIRCESSFPFSLFRSRQHISFGQMHPASINQIWVTPALMESDVPRLVHTMLSRGQMADGVRAGESQEYFGSREYRYGDFVRRWDFAAWARLGRPIARQFDQSSTGNVTIVVDTFIESTAAVGDESKFERRLSLAASIIDSLRYTRCQICLILPRPEGVEHIKAEHTMQEVLLRPLATAIGIRFDRSEKLLSSREQGWSKIQSLIEPNDTLICVMARNKLDPSLRSTSAVDSERRAFLTMVEGLPASLVVSPEEKYGRSEAHEVQ